MNITDLAAYRNIDHKSYHNFDESSCYKEFKSFPHNPWFSRVSSTCLFQTLWKKEILLVTSNFSFSHSVSNLFGDFLPFPSNLKLLTAT